LLGEHVGGSAVRATCFIPKTYTITDKSCDYGSTGISDDITIENKDETLLLISVGSKQVLTTWILQPRIENAQVCLNGLDVDSKQSSKNSESGDLAMSFQWLTTHMPPKLTRNRLKAGHIKQSGEEGSFSAVQPNMGVMDPMENDWRYLSVTSFLLKHPVLR
jgi:hypothetical protein